MFAEQAPFNDGFIDHFHHQIFLTGVKTNFFSSFSQKATFAILQQPFNLKVKYEENIRKKKKCFAANKTVEDKSRIYFSLMQSKF